MILIYTLFLEFFKIGLFAIGGGYASLPFLYHLGSSYGWFSPKDLTQMLAIANIVPGPVGINLASLAGFKAGNFWGALTTVIAIMIPSIIFVLVISKLLKEFEGNKFVKSIFYMLKPASCAMIAAIGLKLFKAAVLKDTIDFQALILFIVLILLGIKKDKSPLFYLGVSALVGILIHIMQSFFIG